MTRYRICPHGLDRWKVQEKDWMLGWFDVRHEVGMDTHETMSFALESEAEAWIRDQVARADLERIQRALEKQRSRDVVPRPFP